MPIPLPNLDDRRWDDLVAEGRSVLTRHAPGWTDHNAHDPGITFLELAAYHYERLSYRCNRISDRLRRKFLALTGHDPRGALPARAVMSVELRAGAGPLELPAGVEFTAASSTARSFNFSTRHTRVLHDNALLALIGWDGSAAVDHLQSARDGLAFAPFGSDPDASATTGAGPALLLGFAGPLSDEKETTLHLEIVDGTVAERERLLAEATRRVCPAPPDCSAGRASVEQALPVSVHSPAALLAGWRHHSATILWEYYGNEGWQELSPENGQVRDETRALTLSGRVVVQLPVPTAPATSVMQPVALHGTEPVYWLRARLVEGQYDAPPRLRRVLFNAVDLEQAAVAWQDLVIAKGVSPAADPVVGQLQTLWLQFDSTGSVVGIEVGGTRGAELLVLDYTPPTPTEQGSIRLPLLALGAGEALPDQTFQLLSSSEATAGALVVPSSTRAWVTDATSWRAVRPVVDLDASGPLDLEAVVDAEVGELHFGDGEHGVTPAAEDFVLAAFQSTFGAAGNVRGSATWSLSTSSAVNAALLGDPESFAQDLAGVAAPIGAAGGAPPESVGDAARRAARTLWAHERIAELCSGEVASLDGLDRATVIAREEPVRAVTLCDYERIALTVPGTRIERARAWAGLDPALPCLTASGTVTVVVVPRLPRRRPMPSRALLEEVRRYLDQRRTIGTRLIVAPPTYVEVAVRATLVAVRGSDPERVRASAERALASFFDPLRGGPFGRGWPFGRNIYFAEVMAELDRATGVAHVRSLQLVQADGTALCGNLCVAANALVALSATELEVAET